MTSRRREAKGPHLPASAKPTARSAFRETDDIAIVRVDAPTDGLPGGPKRRTSRAADHEEPAPGTDDPESTDCAGAS